jgi:hypothetical protein
MSPSTPQELEARYRAATAKVEQLRTQAANYQAAKDLHTARLAELTDKLRERFGVASVEEAMVLVAQLSDELDTRLAALEAQLT